MNDDEIEVDMRDTGLPQSKRDALIGLDIAHGFSPKFEEFDPLSYDHGKKKHSAAVDKSIEI